MNRTWTVSSDPEWIRRYVKIQISVKRAAFVSAWLHEHLQVLFRRGPYWIKTSMLEVFGL